MRSSAIWFWLAVFIALGARTESACADEAQLVTGGRITGVIRQEPGSNLVVVETPLGRIAAKRDQIVDINKATPAALEYQKRAPATADTAEAQWALAQWCFENELRAERAPHVRRVIELEPNHAAARAALGFSFHDGKWVMVGQRMQDDGFVFVSGFWRSPQELKVLKDLKRKHSSERQWKARVVRLVNMLGTYNQERAAAELAEIDHVDALPALMEVYREPNPRAVRLLLLEAIARIDDEEARRGLIETTLYEPDEEMAHRCVLAIRETVPPDVLKDEFTELLQSESNYEINRAAWVLRELDSVETMPQLISALITSHVVSGARPKPKVIGKRKKPLVTRPEVTQSFANEEVLFALTKLSGGENFGYDQQAWANWLAVQNRRDKIAAENR